MQKMVSTGVSHAVRSFVETIGDSAICSPDVLDDARASQRPGKGYASFSCASYASSDLIPRFPWGWEMTR